DRYCRLCDRHFDSAHNLQAHQKLVLHQCREIRCLFFDICSKGFPSEAAMLLHLEQSSCTSGITARDIQNIVWQADSNGIITDDQTKQVHCARCSSKRPFFSDWAKKQHVDNPSHDLAAIYKCSLETCDAGRYKSLGALWQHMESERCALRALTSTGSWTILDVIKAFRH
ncbi:hypothetical protein C8J56DRAFT_804389, partial [Mycena floridula]